MAALRALFAFCCCLAALPVLTLLRGKTKARFKKWFMGIGCRLVDCEIVQHSHPLAAPVLLVSNHVSYIDVIVLQQLEDGDLSFTPKREIARWLVIGWVTNLYDCVYIDRSRGKAKQASDLIHKALKRPRRVHVFAEGTTSDGRALQRFKSTLFGLAEEWDGPQPLPVQPVTLYYSHRDGSPLIGEEWEKIAWYGEMTLAPHLMRAFRGLRLTAHLLCGEPMFLAPGEDRKAFARRVEQVVRATLADPFGNTREKAIA